MTCEHYDCTVTYSCTVLALTRLMWGHKATKVGDSVTRGRPASHEGFCNLISHQNQSKWAMLCWLLDWSLKGDKTWVKFFFDILFATLMAFGCR